MTLLFIGVCAGLFSAFGVSSYTARLNLPSVLVLLFAYCMATTSAVYLAEKLFDEPSMGQLIILCTNMLIGMLTLVITLILNALWWVKVHKYLLVFCIYQYYKYINSVSAASIFNSRSVNRMKMTTSH